VGVVNLGPSAAQATIHASDLHLAHAVTKARNLWSHKDVKFARDAYTAPVPSHGVLLLRVWAQ
jgi:alpha-galactosidase